jgi:hypothetical protein
MRIPLSTPVLSVLAACALVSVAGCGAGTDKNAPAPLGHGSGDDASAPDEGLSLGGEDADFVLPDSGGGGGHLDPDAACAATSFTGTRVPPSILLIFDQSGSMSSCPDPFALSCPGKDKWSSATAAIHDLLATAPHDLNVGIKFFSVMLPGAKACTSDSSCSSNELCVGGKCATESCSDSDYANPDVAVAPLSSTQTPIDCWLGKATCPGITAAKPMTNTVMAPALRGGISYLKSLKADGQRIAILITDGDPTSCTGNAISDVIAAAGAGASGSPRVVTYAIGVPGATIKNLSPVAAAGGGKRMPSCIANTTNEAAACHYQIGAGNVQADLLAALNDITGKSLSCVFKVPAASGDAGVDPGAVNVNLTSGGATSTLNRDATHANGWDYTDGGATITLYGAPCTSVLGSGSTKVDILLGCPTKVPQ